jgi:hypothetical protein
MAFLHTHISSGRFAHISDLRAVCAGSDVSMQRAFVSLVFLAHQQKRDLHSLLSFGTEGGAKSKPGL